MELTYRDALRDALIEEMERDEDVFIIGEDVELAFCFQVTRGLVEKFGKKRVLDTPISEAAIAGIAVGAAMLGKKPIAEIQFMDFVTLAMDQIVNQAAKMKYMTGGQISIPVVYRMPMGYLGSFAAQHSQSLHAWFAHVPGLIVVAPSTPSDAKGLLKSAIRSNSPVVFLEHKQLYNLKGEVPEDINYLIPLGKSMVYREGKDVTIIAVSYMVQKSLKAAEELSKEKIEVSVIDMRTIRPIDKETIISECSKTGRVLIVDEGVRSFGISGEVSALISEYALDYLNAPIKRIGADEVPIPFCKKLEDHIMHNENKIIKAAKELLEY